VRLSFSSFRRGGARPECRRDVFCAYYPLAENNLAYPMLEHGGNTDVARSLAQTARQKLPDSPDVADTLAWAYYKKGVNKLAIRSPNGSH
jgi:hypothetical protein